MHFVRLKPFIESAATGEIRYEFNRLMRSDAPLQDAFFLLPAVRVEIGTSRGVCENLIVLKYLQPIPAKEREELV